MMETETRCGLSLVAVVSQLHNLPFLKLHQSPLNGEGNKKNPFISAAFQACYSVFFAEDSS
jgi:hypothetical protein